MPRFRLVSTLTLLSASAASCAAEPPSKGPAQSQSALETTRSAYYVVLSGPAAAERIPSGVDPRSEAATREVRKRLVELESEHAALRPTVEAAGAQMVTELTRLANAFQVLATPAIAKRLGALPGVVRVERVPVMKPLLGSLLPVVGAPEVWAKATPLQGDGITVGIIDSGIDYTHADFGGPGTVAAYTGNDPKVIEPGSFPTARVVGGWDFVGDDYNPSAGLDNPVPDADPLDCTKPESMAIAGGHGTHVAGIALGGGVTKAGAAYPGPYEVSFNPAAFRVAPGVAPRAKLFSLKVFGCDGSTTMLADALERAADPNKDGSFADRLDVVNASLGTSYALSSPTNGELVKNLTKVGSLLVTAAGNDGQTFFATGSPATYPEALAVAASADNEFLQLSVTSPSSGTAHYAAAEGGFTTPLSDKGKITAELAASQPANGCSPFSNAAAVAGKVALVDRGVCPFVQKFENAVAAGALAVVMVDDADDPLPFAMGGGDPGSIAIPGVMIRLDDGQTIKTALAKETLTVTLDPGDKYVGVGAELLANFSSRGPSALDFRLKPELAAPGFSVDSARVGSGTEARRSQGTSQASPVVTGAAALVRQAHPSFGPMEVKAALVNGTEPLASLTGQVYPTSVVGSGRLAVERSVAQSVTAAADLAQGDVAVSFGNIASDVAVTQKRNVTVTNHAATAASLDAKIVLTHTLPGVSLSVTPTHLDLPAGQSGTVELALALDPVALGSPGPDPNTAPTQSQQARHYLNEASGNLALSAAGAPDVLVPFHAAVRAASKRKAVFTPGCGALDKSVTVELEGASAHPEPVVTAFQLGTLDDERSESATDPQIAMIDLRAVGAATDFATAASFDEAKVYFGVAVAGEFTTPAHGQLSVVAIEIDVDQDGSSDFELRAEPRSKTGPYRDALSSALYQKGSEQRISRYPLNVVTPDVAKTHPFGNSVLVLSTGLKDLGLSADAPTFAYTASAENPQKLLEGEQTVWSVFDPTKPLIDTASHGKNGLPLFAGAGPIEVDVAADARSGGTPLDLLLLHHTNVAGQRFEVVSLTPKAAGNVRLSAVGPDSVGYAESGTVTFAIENAGSEPAPGVKLSGSATGGSITTVTTDHGTCAQASLDCDLGELAAGAKVQVVVNVEPTKGSSQVSANAKVESALACEATASDNLAASSFTVGAAPKPKALHASGGCGCRTAGSERQERPVWFAALALGLAAWLRRVRR